MKIGFILFDDPKESTEGWASESGEEARRVGGVHELDNECLWVTNTPYAHYRDLNLGKLNNIKESHFMRIEPSSLIKELNLDKKPKEATEYVSKIFQRVCNFGLDIYEVNPLEGRYYRYPQMLTSKILPNSFFASPTFKDDSINNILQSATQILQTHIGTKPNGNQTVTLSMPRIAYYKWLLSKKYPSSKHWNQLNFSNGSFEIGFDRKKEISGTKTRIKKLNDLSEEYAILFNIQIKSIDKDYVSFASFGASGNSDTQNSMRSWVTFGELKELARFCKVEVKKAIKTESDYLPDDIRYIYDDGDFSISKGIFLENIFSALSTPSNKKYHGAIPFLRAYDRMACLKIAELLNKENFFVLSYGSGKIVTLCPEARLDELSVLSLSLGLIPPMEHISEQNENIVPESENLINDWMNEDYKDFIDKDLYFYMVFSLAGTGLLNSDNIMKIDGIVDNKDKNLWQELLAKINKEIIEGYEEKESDGNDSFSNNSNDDEVIDI